MSLLTISFFQDQSIIHANDSKYVLFYVILGPSADSSTTTEGPMEKTASPEPLPEPHPEPPVPVNKEEEEENYRRRKINNNILSSHSMKLRTRSNLKLTSFPGFKSWDSLSPKELRDLGMSKKIARVRGATYRWK